MKKFWTNALGSIRFDPEALHNFLKENGYGLLKTGNLEDAILIQVLGRTIKTVTSKEIRNFCWRYIDETYEFKTPEERSEVKNAFYRDKTLFSSDNLLLMPVVELNELQDTATTSYMLFKNCILRITASGIEKIKYEEIEGHVFEKDIINFELTRDDCDGPYGIFNFFIANISDNENQVASENNYSSLISIIGYILHRYKDPSNAKAIVFMDPYRGDGANGGTGKSLLTKAFERVRPSVYEDGKFFHTKDRFALSQIDYNTRILSIDDIPENFDFSKLFPLITEKAVIERKYQNKYTVLFERSPKIVITTNYVLKGLDESTKRRKIDFIFSAHYNQKNTPESEHGGLFFIEWGKEEWEDFYFVMANCISVYLESGIIMPKFNVAERALKMEAPSAFIEYVNTEIKPNVKYNKKTVYDAFYTKNPTIGRMELTTFRKWLKLYADAYGYKMNETHSGNDNFFEYSQE
jgi:Family of unknown function (DUF5906)